MQKEVRAAIEKEGESGEYKRHEYEGAKGKAQEKMAQFQNVKCVIVNLAI